MFSSCRRKLLGLRIVNKQYRQGFLKTGEDKIEIGTKISIIFG